MISKKEFQKVDLGVCVGDYRAFLALTKKHIRSKSTLCLGYPERALDIYYGNDWPEFALCRRIFEYTIEGKLWLLTRSPALLETLWAFFILKKTKKPRTNTSKLLPWADKDELTTLLKKNIKVYRIDKDRLFDLEDLNPNSSNKLIASWGGMLDYPRLVGGIIQSVTGGS